MKNPYTPNFEHAAAGEAVFHVAYGLVKILYTRIAEYNKKQRISISIDGKNNPVDDSMVLSFDDNGIEHLPYTIAPKHPSIFRSQEQCKNYWVWEHYHG